MSEYEAALAHFKEVAEKNGIATFPVSNGRIFMFKSDYLRRLLLTNNSPALKIGVRQVDGSVKNVLLGHDRLQSELDATTQPLILIFLTDGPIQN